MKIAMLLLVVLLCVGFGVAFLGLKRLAEEHEDCFDVSLFDLNCWQDEIHA